MSLYKEILKKEENLSVIGLGYVGMPIAVSFSKSVNVIGFDIDSKKIELYKNGVDVTNEIGNSEIKNCSVNFTSNESELKKAKFHIVAVPTPVTRDNRPNLNPVISACEIVGRNLKKGSIVVFESTVYPGVTEDVCIPVIELTSGYICGIDFKVGYSPERINPGDKEHRLDNIIKIVSGMDNESLKEISDIYSIVAKAGVYKAKSIKVAEAAKVIENSQRDINIAFMNELSIIFDKLNIDTKSVLEAASTKWNFLKFYPGLVGGHCIGVDPYYLTYKAEEVGYHSQVILSGRRINDGMGKFIAEKLIKLLISNNININKAKIGILGFTFKENCPDIRNTKVIDIIKELMEYGISPDIHDPYINKDFEYEGLNVRYSKYEDMNNMDAIIIAVPHNEYKNLSIVELAKKYSGSKKIIIDVKGIFDKELYLDNEFNYWRL